MALDYWQYTQPSSYDATQNPSAYGSIPDIPETTTNITRTTAGWSPTIPDYELLAPQASKVAATQMAGKLAPDVIAQIAQGAAERGVAIGAPTSPNADAAYLRALGLTSQGLQQQGMTNYLSLLAQSPRITTNEAQQILSNNVLRATYAAAPNPYAAAMANLAAQQRGLGAGGAAGGGGGYPVSTPASTYTPSYTQPSGFYPTVNPLTGQTVSPAYDTVGTDDMTSWLAEIGYDPYGYPIGSFPIYSQDWGEYFGDAGTYYEPSEDMSGWMAELGYDPYGYEFGSTPSYSLDWGEYFE